MKIAMFGATGFTGRSVLQEALERGHEVRVSVRDPARLDVSHAALTVQRGNALDAADVLQLVEGTDAVLHCIGVGGKGDGKPTTLVSDSVALVLDAMRQTGASRLVCMSNMGAGGSGPWWGRLAIKVALRWLIPLIEDKERMESLLGASDVDWVAVRLPNIVEGPPKPVRVSEHGRDVAMSITTASVARFMLDQVGAPRLVFQTPSASN